MDGVEYRVSWHRADWAPKAKDRHAFFQSKATADRKVTALLNDVWDQAPLTRLSISARPVGVWTEEEIAVPTITYRVSASGESYLRGL